MIKRILFATLLSVQLAASPAPEEIPEEEESEFVHYDYKGQMFKLLLTLSALVVIVGGGAYAIKRLGRSRLMSAGTSSGVRILTRRPLSQKSAVYLIEVEGQRLLVGDSLNGGLCTLHTLTPKQEEGDSPSFREIIEKRLAKNSAS